jgi:hypothetical protein
VVIEADVVAGYVIGWVMRKARRAGERLDTEGDADPAAGLGQLHEVVSTKLGPDRVLGLEVEAAIGQVSELTRHRVELAIQAAGQDEGFASRVAVLLQQVRSLEQNAQGVWDLAGSELERLLDGTPLQQDLLGLLTAATGGLSGPDLAHLTGAPVSEIEGFLRGVSGRIFVRRPARFWSLSRIPCKPAVPFWIPGYSPDDM